MFLGERATFLKLMVCMLIAVASLLLYALKGSVFFVLLGEAITAGILWRGDRFAVVTSRASFSLMSVSAFLASENITSSVIFLFSAIFLLHSPIFLILNPPPSRVVLRRITGSAFLLVFLVVGEKLMTSLLFLLCCLLLLLQDYFALKGGVTQPSRGGRSTSRK